MIISRKLRNKSLLPAHCNTHAPSMPDTAFPRLGHGPHHWHLLLTARNHPRGTEHNWSPPWAVDHSLGRQKMGESFLSWCKTGSWHPSTARLVPQGMSCLSAGLPSYSRVTELQETCPINLDIPLVNLHNLYYYLLGAENIIQKLSPSKVDLCVFKEGWKQLPDMNHSKSLFPSYDYH